MVAYKTSRPGKGIPDKWLYFLIAVMGVYLLIRLVDQAKMAWIFPLDTTNDISSFMGLLYFLAKYGFHNLAPEWYGGISVLKFYSPGWFFFTLPLYWLTQSVQMASYISLVLLYIIAAAFVYLLGRSEGWSLAKRAAFFLIFFANAISIGNFIRLGAMPTFFAWVFFIALFGIILYYRNRKIDYRFFLLFIPTFAIMIISHPQETVLSGALLVSFLLTNRERVKILISSLIALLITAFWWFPFLKDISESTVSEYVLTRSLLDFSGPLLIANIITTLAAVAVLAVFFLYWRSIGYTRKELLFFLPVGVLAALVMTRLIIFIPFFNQVYLDSYTLLFTLFILFFFFNLNFSKTKSYIKFGVCALLLILPLASVGISQIHTPYFAKHSPLAEDVLDMLSKVEGTYLILDVLDPTAYSRAFYSYGAISLNLSTASGWSTHEISPERRQMFTQTSSSFKSKDCDRFKDAMDAMSVEEIISYKESCDTLKDCGFKRKAIKNDICLYQI